MVAGGWWLVAGESLRSLERFPTTNHQPPAHPVQNVNVPLNWTIRPSSISDGCSHSGP